MISERHGGEYAICRIAEKGGYADLCIRDGKVCILYETNTTEGMDLVFTTVDL